MNNHYKQLQSRVEHTSFYTMLEQEIYMKEAGTAGEAYVASYLQNIDITVIPDVVLDGEQIDFILLHDCFIVVCEVKNWKGQLTFSRNPPQVLQDGKRILTSPELQLPNKIRALQTFVQDVPIYGCIILASTNVTFTAKPQTFPLIFVR